jgi:hypothetical protein
VQFLCPQVHLPMRHASLLACHSFVLGSNNLASLLSQLPSMHQTLKREVALMPDPSQRGQYYQPDDIRQIDTIFAFNIPRTESRYPLFPQIPHEQGLSWDHIASEIAS